MYMSVVLPAFMCVYHKCAYCAHGGQMRALDSLELGLWIVMYRNFFSQ